MADETVTATQTLTVCMDPELHDKITQAQNDILDNLGNVPDALSDITKLTNVNMIVQDPNNKNDAWIPYNNEYLPSAETGTEDYDNEIRAGIDNLGILDRMLETLSVNLNAQYQSGRIRQENYASIYAQLYQATLQSAIQYLFTQAELQRKLDLEKAQTLSEICNQELTQKDICVKEETIQTYQRQRKGYDEDFAIKAGQMAYNSYIAFLTAMPQVPNQPYPSLFTGFYHLDDNQEKKEEGNATEAGYDTNEDMPLKLRYLDGFASRIYEKLAEYFPDQVAKPES